MRTVNAAAQAIREQRKTIREVPMMLIRTRNRTTNELVPLGLWMGEDNEDILIRDIFTGVSSTRSFYTGMVGMGDVTHEAGLNVRPLEITLSRLEPAVRIAFYEHDPRGAQVQVFRRAYDPDTGRPVAGFPEAEFAGYVNTAPDSRPSPGGDSIISVDVVSTAMMLTIPSASTKSDATQRKRSGDRFRRYKATASQWEIPWAAEDNAG